MFNIFLWIFVLIILSIVFANQIDDVYDALVLLRPLPVSFKQSIEKHNGFYQQLPAESKRRFEKKVNQFVRTKQFIPRNLSKVTDEMKALIASAAIQLTFGLPKVTLKHFDRIIVYPDNYYSVINRQYHKGEVNPRLNAIVVSWWAFVEGYADPHDGVNLGLHEMAHALKLENIIQNGEHHFFDLKEYKKWLSLAADEMDKIRKGEDSLFREYASVDEDEFFATGMEVYFEQPHKLFDYNPELYKTLSNLLHQDTIQLYKQSNA
ncbi:MAG: DgsA anti-repressor MtfA [Bacteroidetes bacterium]|nr:MAG: DgsA anti-repressor MtfA [Bacteroidota bacterium]